jgi:predicted ferric reductase
MLLRNRYLFFNYSRILQLFFCVYYPTAPVMLHQILKIARHLNAFENDALLRQVIVHMKDKFLNWRDIRHTNSICVDVWICGPNQLVK